MNQPETVGIGSKFAIVASENDAFVKLDPPMIESLVFKPNGKRGTKMTKRIRFAEPRDAAAIQAIYAPNVESTAISFELRLPTVEEMARRMAKLSTQYPWLVCEIDGQIAGYVYACSHRERAAYRWAVDVTVYVDAAHRRRGVGRALYTSLFPLLRQQGVDTGGETACRHNFDTDGSTPPRCGGTGWQRRNASVPGYIRRHFITSSSHFDP